jgi:hypothetical protein
LALRVVILLIVSIGFESLFIEYGLNSMDEGWPLHAAMEMHDGKALYDEVFWVFPPGHVLPAWVGYGLAPPGLIGARVIYAGFNVALCVGLFFVARRLMPADFALLAGLLVAIAAPKSHLEHLLFGYRYLVLSVVALLFFYLRLNRHESHWLFFAGVFAGIALFFRITPAFAVSVAVGVGILAANRDWRQWLRDGLWYSAGLVLFWIPILLWMHYTVGLEKLWIEMIVRPIEMTALQSKPLPPLFVPELRRAQISFAFAALGFRLYPLLYLGFALVLLYQWGRSVWLRRPFEHVFLLTFVVFGGTYFVRSMGRSDIPHLDSAIPPVAVLLAYCASLSTRISGFRPEIDGRKAILRRWALCVGVFVAWSFSNASDRSLSLDATMGDSPLRATSGRIKVGPRNSAKVLDKLIPLIQAHSEPDDTILVMSSDPLVHVLAERHGPGYFDVIIPGTFRSPEEEQTFLERIEDEPPAVVVWPRFHFDNMVSRGVDRIAPRLTLWVTGNYHVVAKTPVYLVLVPEAEEQADPPPER